MGEILEASVRRPQRTARDNSRAEMYGATVAQAALDENFNQMGQLIAAKSKSITEMDVRRWMRSVNELLARGELPEAMAFHYRAVAYQWLGKLEESIRNSRLALQRRNTDPTQRAGMLLSHASILLQSGELVDAVSAAIEAIRSNRVDVAFAAAVLVQSLCALGQAEDAASVADEYLSDCGEIAGHALIMAAQANALLGRDRLAVELLARHALEAVGQERGDQPALSILNTYRASVESLLDPRETVRFAWLRLEAQEKALAELRSTPDQPTSAPEVDEPDWVRVLRGRAVQETLSAESTK